MKENPPKSAIAHLLYPIISTKQEQINDWFKQHYSRTPPFLYSSVDIRHSGYKMAPVDTNLFPAGFNLLSQEAIEKGAKALKSYLEQHYPNAQRLLLLPENHTRNTLYLDNVAALFSLLKKAGIDAQIGTIATDSTENQTSSEKPLILTSANNTELTLQQVIRNNDYLQLSNGFVPDIVLVNNDLSSGAPEILQNLKQPVVPPVGMGWYRRRKTSHFDTYSEVARLFGQDFGIDPWLISTLFSHCGQINFKDRTGIECLAINVERTLHKIARKYESYNIDTEPYVFIKAASGTYGMGIMTVRNVNELLEMNKKARNKMYSIKEGAINTEVIIQEGIPTIDTIQGRPAEPMIYLIGGQAIGCTYRVNESRDAYSNLNSRGMTFHNIAATDGEAAAPDAIDPCPVQSLVSKLATLAASRECYEPDWEI